MKKLFTAIRKRDDATIIELIGKKPELVNCTAKQPPKKDDGQSPLQVAFKTRNFWAAKFLLDHGANVNFIEQESVNEWRMPVLQDAIMATISMVRFARPVDPWDPERKGEYELGSTKEKFDKTFALLKTMVEKGADVNAVDSYGNNCLMRACIDVENLWVNKPEPLNKEAVEDIGQVFHLLLSAGADLYQKTATRDSVHEQYKEVLDQVLMAPNEAP